MPQAENARYRTQLVSAKGQSGSGRRNLTSDGADRNLSLRAALPIRHDLANKRHWRRSRMANTVTYLFVLWKTLADEAHQSRARRKPNVCTEAVGA